MRMSAKQASQLPGLSPCRMRNTEHRQGQTYVGKMSWQSVDRRRNFVSGTGPHTAEKAAWFFPSRDCLTVAVPQKIKSTG
jgi:hypothetical protein